MLLLVLLLLLLVLVLLLEGVANLLGHILLPNQQRTLHKLPTELRCRNFVRKHRLSVQIGAERAKTCTQRVHIPTELPFLPATVGGWALFLFGARA